MILEEADYSCEKRYIAEKYFVKLFVESFVNIAYTISGKVGDVNADH